jgi:hypothetical protein
LKGTGGSEQVGSLPVPWQTPASQTVKAGQSQSSKQGQYAFPSLLSTQAADDQVLLPHVTNGTGALPLGGQISSVSPWQVVVPGEQVSSAQISPLQNLFGGQSRSVAQSGSQ